MKPGSLSDPVLRAALEPGLDQSQPQLRRNANPPLHVAMFANDTAAVRYLFESPISALSLAPLLVGVADVLREAAGEIGAICGWEDGVERPVI